eukprot:c20535_g2_i1.p1 GENE.c20535_g2_i1~~c20535_g2_i1.p1  ORF type:complete len:344 (+),score=159.55 c20535_g2_i1:48-1079(+)
MTVPTLVLSDSSHGSDVSSRYFRMICQYLAIGFNIKNASEFQSGSQSLPGHFPALYFEELNLWVYGHGAIVRTLARLAPAKELCGATLSSQALVDEWIERTFGDISTRVASLGQLQNVPESVKSKFQSMVEDSLASVEHQLTQTRFIASNGRPTIADFCLFASLLNFATQRPEFKGFGIASEANSTNPRPKLARWVYHLSNLISVSSVLGEGWLAPWGGKNSSESSNELSEHPSFQYFAGLLPTQKNQPKTSAQSESQQKTEKFVGNKNPLKSHQKTTETISLPKINTNQKIDWDSLNFFNMPFPNFANVVEAPKVAEADDFGASEVIKRSKSALEEQWRQHA